MKTMAFGDASVLKRAPEKGLLVNKLGLLSGIWSTTLVLLAGIVFFSYLQLKSIQAQQLSVFENTIANLVRVNEEHAVRTFRAADQTLSFMLAEYAVKQGKLDLAGMVASGVIDASLFAQVGIIDAAGIGQFSNIPFASGLDLSDRPHFKIHQLTDTGALYISKAVLGRASGKWSIQLTRRINNPDGSFGGVAVVSVNAEYFSKFYAELVLPEKSAAVLVGLDGEIRVREADQGLTANQDLSSAPLFKLLANGQPTGMYTAISGIDGVERTTVYRTVAGYPLVVMMGFATSGLASMHHRSRNALVFQAAGLCLLLMLLAAVASFHILKLRKELLERQRLVTQLQSSETRLELALAGGELGTWEWDLAQEKFSTNTQLRNFVGYADDKLVVNRDLLVSLICPQDINEFFSALGIHLNRKSERFRNESRFRHKNGSWVWITLTGRVVARDDRGHAVRLSGTAQDVTSRVNARLALARSEERWHLAVSGSNDGIWDWDVGSGTLFASVRMLTLLDYDSTVPGNPLQQWATYIHPDDAARAREHLLSHFKGRTDFYRVELRLRCMDGSYKWMLVRGRALRDQMGRALRMTGSASDITCQRAAQAQVQDQNERLNAIFSLSPDALVSFDHSCRVKYTNPAFDNLTGLASTDVIGLSENKFTELINSHCAATALFGGLDQLRKLSGPSASKGYGLIEMILPTRRVLQAKLKASESASVSQILYLRDVTHETIVEEMKSEFLSTAAHELRTPMASILGFSEVLLTHKLDEVQNREFLNIILTQSQQMASILDELLDLARIEARQEKDFVFETLNLSLTVNQVLKGFSIPPGRSAPVVAIEGGFVSADSGKAKQAILNVLSNAYKYSPPGGQVSITFVESFDKDKGMLCGICIEDQGYGMNSEQLSRVFERFYRADASGKTPGTGLGMSIVKEIMAVHAGKVIVESVSGEGTSVTLLFPAASREGLQDPIDGSDFMSLI